MKKLLLSLSVVTLLTIGACSEGDGEAEIVTPTCSAVVSGLAVTQQHNILNVNINAAPGALYYEVSMLNTGGSQMPDNGSITTLENNTGSIDLFGDGGSFLFYARTVCADGSKSNWFGPKLLTIQPFCDTPEILNVTSFGVDWGSVIGVTNFQLQYGPAGFAMGTGTTVNVDNDYYSNMSMSAGQAYDFYVRAYCPASSSYGNWSQKYTYMSESNINMCMAPTNITAVYNGSTHVSFHFNGNGEDTWEYALTNTGQAPTQSQINLSTPGYWPGFSIPSNYHGTFYIRAVCDNGNRTGWVTLTI